MAEESFLLVSLKEDKAKKLAQVLSNDTSLKILEFLSSNKEATETEIGKALGLPASTVHYNMKHLSEAGLVDDDLFHYSEKGKEVTHYSLTNKYVIIAPNNIEGLKDKLSRILPVFAAVAAATAGVWKFFGQGMARSAADPGLMGAAPEAMTMVADDVARNAAMKAVPIAADAAATQPVPNIALWFLAGSVFALCVAYAWTYAYSRIKKRK